MVEPLTQLKDIEKKVHEHLYQNVLLLTHVYPTSKQFDAVFTRDMFVKNNKAAFHQVVYYLLNILSPETIKEKIPSWPPYDMKMENKFRTEVLMYINQLNSLYEDVNVPHIMASHLISPGGVRFVKFMMKLSQLVLLQHLKRINCANLEIMNSIKPNKNPAVTKLIISNLKNRSVAIEHELKERVEHFNSNFENSKLTANQIISNYSELNKKLSEVKKEFEAKKNTFDQESFPVNIQLIHDQLNHLRHHVNSLKQLEQTCNECDHLLTNLLSGNALLEYNKDDTHIPNQITNLIKLKNNKVDLLELFNGFNVLLEYENLNMTTFTTSQLNNLSQTYVDLCDKYSQIHKKLITTKNNLLESLEVFQLNFSSNVSKGHKKEVQSMQMQLSSFDETLAVPLNFSE